MRPRPRDLLAWSFVLASTFGLASLFEAVAASALAWPVTSTPIPVQLSPATAAVADGDDLHTRLLVSRPELASFLVSRPDP